MSNALLSMNSITEQKEWIQEHRAQVLHERIATVITCMGRAVHTELGAEFTNLILGSEAGQVYILNPGAASVDTTIQLPSTPVTVIGSYDDDTTLRVFAACRDAKVYSIKVSLRL